MVAEKDHGKRFTATFRAGVICACAESSVVFNTGPYSVLPENSILITANMQSETGFPSGDQLKSYVAYKSRLKLAARAVLSADAGLLVTTSCIKALMELDDLTATRVNHLLHCDAHYCHLCTDTPENMLLTYFTNNFTTRKHTYHMFKCKFSQSKRLGLV